MQEEKICMQTKNFEDGFNLPLLNDFFYFLYSIPRTVLSRSRIMMARFKEIKFFSK